ncbi:MAG: hypothetical protein IKN87_00400 [Bacilli bacterium]|nr:hypothetical protein [Bacilli bacterium]
MIFFDNIIARAEKKHLKERNMKYFLDCLTTDSLEEFNKMEAELKSLSNFFYDNYDTLLRYKWHLSSDFTILYKEDSDAYLIMGENGFAIDKDKEQSAKALEEEEELLVHGHDIVTNLYKYSCKYIKLHNKDWLTKPFTDRETFETIGQSLGYLKGLNVEKEKNITK